MAKFIKGDVVVLPFPFFDLSGSKRRPALVLADLPGDDILLCQITSQRTKDSNAIAVFQLILSLDICLLILLSKLTGFSQQIKVLLFAGQER